MSAKYNLVDDLPTEEIERFDKAYSDFYHQSAEDSPHKPSYLHSLYAMRAVLSVYERRRDALRQRAAEVSVREAD